MTTRERIGELESQVSSLQSQLEFTRGEVREWQEIAASRRRIIIEQLAGCQDNPDMRVLGDSLDRCREKLTAYRTVLCEIKAQIAELEKWEEKER